MYFYKSPPADISSLPQYCADQFRQVAEGMSAPVDTVQYTVMDAPPKRLKAGMVACANGTTWNPTSGGFGLYLYNGTAWLKLN